MELEAAYTWSCSLRKGRGRGDLGAYWKVKGCQDVAVLGEQGCVEGAGGQQGGRQGVLP